MELFLRFCLRDETQDVTVVPQSLEVVLDQPHGAVEPFPEGETVVDRQWLADEPIPRDAGQRFLPVGNRRRRRRRRCGWRRRHHRRCRRRNYLSGGRGTFATHHLPRAAAIVVDAYYVAVSTATASFNTDNFPMKKLQIGRRQLSAGRSDEAGVERGRQVDPSHKLGRGERLPARRRESVVPKDGTERVTLLAGVDDDTHRGGDGPGMDEGRLPGRGRRRRVHATMVVIITVIVVAAVDDGDIAVVKDDKLFLGHALSLLLRPANALELQVGKGGDEAPVLHVELERGRVVEDRAAIGDTIPAHHLLGRCDLRVFRFVDHPSVNRDGGKRGAHSSAQ